MRNALRFAGRDAQRLARHVFNRAHNLPLQRRAAEKQHHRRRERRNQHWCARTGHHCHPGHKQCRHHTAQTPAQWNRREFAPPGVAQHQPFEQTARFTPFTQRFIKRLYRRNLFRAGSGTNRHKTGYFSAAHHRCHVGTHPVVIAVFTAVFNNAGPGLALLQRVPHIGESRFGHIGVTHQIVRAAGQFL